MIKEGYAKPGEKFGRFKSELERATQLASEGLIWMVTVSGTGRTRRRNRERIVLKVSNCIPKI